MHDELLKMVSSVLNITVFGSVGIKYT